MNPVEAEHARPTSNGRMTLLERISTEVALRRTQSAYHQRGEKVVNSLSTFFSEPVVMPVLLVRATNTAQTARLEATCEIRKLGAAAMSCLSSIPKR